MAVEVYDASGYLGRFWTHDVSQEGLFLRADPTDRLTSTILRLWFEGDGVACSLRGTAVRAVEGQGVGVQLAFWRRGDEAAYAAYGELIAAYSGDRAYPGDSVRHTQRGREVKSPLVL